ncbi:MAG: LacI family transcriptional regulator [Alicyclobacillus herbarius]|uniref:LacI family DNA-binding transcriptional regulator n=1 Tax=Alicyclobacillus herbarius TaxID=122960 RepID=UPI002353C7DA|nr:LacI family DNA-binding transcriptional regulator [Alicyclobacillus herbarius]MCL6633157.1 LacI family transcriptional regulator [Alicyclobacillus herbarius]
MKFTMEDVAKLSGVSKSTVSRILSGKNVNISEKTRQKVLSVVRELNYRPNELARSLKMAQTRVIGLILSDLKNPFWMTVLDGVEEACNHFGYHLMICNSANDGEKEQEYILSLQQRRVDGILINPTAHNKEMLARLIQTGFPLVFLNRTIQGIIANSVVVNNRQGIRLAVEHLLEQGYRKIALVTYNEKGVSTWTERVEGYQEGLQAHGILSQAVWRKDAGMDLNLSALLEAYQADALIVTNNVLALYVIERLRELNLRIPADIAIVGYDETVWAKHLTPPLTTIKQPARDLGRIATESVIKMIHGERLSEETVTLTPEIVIRESSLRVC